MAVPSLRGSGLCEICHEPVPRLDAGSHMLAAHPDIVAVRRAAGRRFLTRYLPLAVVATVFAALSGTLHAWWWRMGLLAGIYAICALFFLSLVGEWRAEKPLRLRVELPCAVCGDRILSAAFEAHMRVVHPTLSRVAKRAQWMVFYGLYAVMGYILVLVGIAILGVFGEPLWSVYPVLAFVPPLAYLILLALLYLAINRRFLRPAQRQWQATHPRDPS